MHEPGCQREERLSMRDMDSCSICHKELHVSDSHYLPGSAQKKGHFACIGEWSAAESEWRAALLDAKCLYDNALLAILSKADTSTNATHVMRSALAIVTAQFGDKITEALDAERDAKIQRLQKFEPISKDE